MKKQLLLLSLVMHCLTANGETSENRLDWAIRCNDFEKVARIIEGETINKAAIHQALIYLNEVIAEKKKPLQDFDFFHNLKSVSKAALGGILFLTGVKCLYDTIQWKHSSSFTNTLQKLEIADQASLQYRERYTNDALLIASSLSMIMGGTLIYAGIRNFNKLDQKNYSEALAMRTILLRSLVMNSSQKPEQN